ncbi:hypothetical protein SY83_08140 [Paenibacillus swuensis]|uniref:Uncharacterized protein n=1 Tax=Paenibacillus swuensis TaxID=1178515 RepID=A0A172TH11_9BACL|nr:hypothetical protein [Paenibacillus swuensis]ANE46246.1 hypothetical protein SY83_08140 [Paenibacillus swuensis]
MMKKMIVLMMALLLLLPVSVGQATSGAAVPPGGTAPTGGSCSCVSIVGDDDNFGRQTCCWDVTHEPDDGVFDAWNPAPKMWTHTVSIPTGSTITDAVLTIKSFNVQDANNAFDVKLYVDGAEIANAFDSVYNQTDTVTVFQLEPSIFNLLVDGNIQVLVTNAEGAPQDSFAIDFSKLEINYLCAKPAKIDIKPWFSPNCILNHPNWLIPVALLGSQTFSVRNVNDSTVRFGDKPNAGSAKLWSYTTDINYDGFADKIYVFPFQGTGFDAGDITGYLSGTHSGVKFLGTDSVKIVNISNGR